MDIYTLVDKIPLSFSRVRAFTPVTGLTVTVTVKNAQTGATLLAATSCPEVASGSGIYTYVWAHGLSSQTECLVQYSVSGGGLYEEHILVIDSDPGSKTA